MLEQPSRSDEMVLEITLDVICGPKNRIPAYRKFVLAVSDEKGTITNGIDPSGDAVRVSVDRL